MKEFIIKHENKQYKVKANDYNEAISSIVTITAKDDAGNLDTINALIADERAAVNAYNVALKNLEGKIPADAIKVITAIRDDENRHIENLQAVVNGNITEKNLKDATGHEVVVYTNQLLSEMGLNNSIGKYDKVVQAMRSLYSESLKSGEELKEVIRRDMPRILKKYGYKDSIKDDATDVEWDKLVDMGLADYMNDIERYNRNGYDWSVDCTSPQSARKVAETIKRRGGYVSIESSRYVHYSW